MKLKSHCFCFLAGHASQRYFVPPWRSLDGSICSVLPTTHAPKNSNNRLRNNKVCLQRPKNMETKKKKKKFISRKNKWKQQHYLLNGRSRCVLEMCVKGSKRLRPPILMFGMPESVFATVFLRDFPSLCIALELSKYSLLFYSDSAIGSRDSVSAAERRRPSSKRFPPPPPFAVVESTAPSLLPSASSRRLACMGEALT